MDYTKMFRLDGKKALVAGASRGIGLAIAQAVAAQGANTVLAARSADELEKQAATLNDQGHSASVQALDMKANDSIDACAAAHADTDILINVAGTNIRKRFEDYTPDEYQHLMQIEHLFARAVCRN